MRFRRKIQFFCNLFIGNPVVLGLAKADRLHLFSRLGFVPLFAFLLMKNRHKLDHEKKIPVGLSLLSKILKYI